MVSPNFWDTLNPTTRRMYRLASDMGMGARMSPAQKELHADGVENCGGDQVRDLQSRMIVAMAEHRRFYDAWEGIAPLPVFLREDAVRYLGVGAWHATVGNDKAMRFFLFENRVESFA